MIGQDAAADDKADDEVNHSSNTGCTIRGARAPNQQHSKCL